MWINIVADLSGVVLEDVQDVQNVDVVVTFVFAIAAAFFFLLLSRLHVDAGVNLAIIIHPFGIAVSDGAVVFVVIALIHDTPKIDDDYYMI